LPGRVAHGVSPGPQDWPHRDPPGRFAIAKAIPAGARRARDQRSWLRAVGADPVIAGLRADKQHAVLGLARVLARHADWKTKTTWRPRALACAEIGSARDPARPLSVSAYKAARRVLEDRGLLGLVSQGWTSALHAAPLDDRTARCAVFVLTIPRRTTRLPGAGGRRRVNRPLAWSRSDLAQPPRTREAPAPKPPDKDRGTGAKDQNSHRYERTDAAALGTLPTTRTEALDAARALRERAAVLRRISAEYLRHLYRPFWRAGWLPRDFLHALDHDPRGRQHGYTAEVRAPAGWVRSRLAAWLGRDGTPLPSRSQRMADERRRIRAEQDARRMQQAAARAHTADYPAAATRAREILTEALARTSAHRAGPGLAPAG
jgi:hypothetical protein